MKYFLPPSNDWKETVQASIANICDGECLNILWEIFCRIPSSSSSFHPLRFWPGPVFVSLFSSFPLFSCSVLGLAAASGGLRRPQAASGGGLGRGRRGPSSSMAFDCGGRSQCRKREREKPSLSIPFDGSKKMHFLRLVLWERRVVATAAIFGFLEERILIALLRLLVHFPPCAR